MMRASLVWALAALLLAVPLAGAQVPLVPIVVEDPFLAPAPAGAPDIELLAPASPLPAKARTNVFLSLLNLGPGAIHNVSILVQPSPGDGIVIVGQLLRGVEDLPANESATLVVRVATPDRAGGGVLTMTFTFDDDLGRRVTLTRAVSLQIAPPRSDPLRVEVRNTTFMAGEEANLVVRFANPSERPIESLDATFSPRVTRALEIGGEVNDLTAGAEGSRILQGARLPAGSQFDVPIPTLTSLRPDDLVEFTILVNYTLDGFERTQSFEFGARATGTTKLRILDARVERVGDGLAMTGTMVNVGTATAWNPRVDVAEGSGYVATRPRLIEDLEPNEAVDFEVPVERAGEATPGAPLLRVEWNDEFGEVHAEPVEGEAEPPPPLPPSFLSRIGEVLLSPATWLVAVLAALVLALALAWRHVRHRRAEELAAEEDAAAGAEPVGVQRPQGRHRAKPGP